MPLLGVGQNQPLPKVSIDTIRFEASVGQRYELKSEAPTFTVEEPSPVIDFINQDIASYFVAAQVGYNASELASSLFDDAETDGPVEVHGITGADSERETFVLTWPSTDLVCVQYQRLLEPIGGRPQYTGQAMTYNIRTGEKYFLKDVLLLESSKLAEHINVWGYYQEPGELNTFKRVYNPMVADVFEKQLKDLLEGESKCLCFYLLHSENELHLQFTTYCSGPSPITYGIALKYLKDSILLDELKEGL